MQPTLIRRCFTEFIGTFALVLGIGIAISREVSPLYIAAITLATLISFFGYVSGGHFNPAVTLGFTVIRKFPLRDLLPYWGSQILGANFAVFLLFYSVLGPPAGLYNLLKTEVSPLHGPYTPNEPLLLEILGSFLFVSLILNIVSSSFIPPKFKGMGVGLGLIMVCTLFSNKADLSLNPARTLGPALYKYNGDSFHLYTKPDGTDVYKPSPPYLMDGLIIALMSLIGGGLAGLVHLTVHRDES